MSEYVHVELYAAVSTPCGTEYHDVTDAEIARIKADPLGFAAKRCGLTVADYLEWNRLHGSAVCGALTTKGKPCKCTSAAGWPLPAAEWKARHLKDRCYWHSERDQ